MVLALAPIGAGLATLPAWRRCAEPVSTALRG